MPSNNSNNNVGNRPMKSKSDIDKAAREERVKRPLRKRSTSLEKTIEPEPDLNPLALPKGERHPCDFCSAPRSLYICHGCRAAYYCCHEHREISYNVVHKAVCDDYHYIRTCPKPVYPQRARERFTKLIHLRQEEIVRKCIRLAHTSLREHRPRDAILQITAGLKLQRGIEGFKSPFLVPTYCMLAEAMTKENRHTEAFGELAKALHIIHENKEDVNLSNIAMYFRIEGCYYMAVDDLGKALTSFAEEVYYATAAYHTEHKLTSYGYFHLGRVFLKLGKVDTAYSHYMHAMDIWFEYLKTLFFEKTKTDKVRVRDFDFEKQVVLTVPDRTIAREILTTIKADTIDKHWEGSPIDSAKLCLSLSMCLFLESNTVQELEEAIDLSRMYEFQTIRPNVSRSRLSFHDSTSSFILHDDEVQSTKEAIEHQISRARKEYDQQTRNKLKKKERDTEVELQRLAHEIRKHASRALNKIRSDANKTQAISLPNMERQVMGMEQSSGRLSFAFSSKLLSKFQKLKRPPGLHTVALDED